MVVRATPKGSAALAALGRVRPYTSGNTSRSTTAQSPSPTCASPARCHAAPLHLNPANAWVWVRTLEKGWVTAYSQKGDIEAVWARRQKQWPWIGRAWRARAPLTRFWWRQSAFPGATPPDGVTSSPGRLLPFRFRPMAGVSVPESAHRRVLPSLVTSVPALCKAGPRASA